MEYRERRPPAALASWVECIWTLRGSGGGPDPVLPDGRTEIVLNYGDRFRRHADDRVERQPRALFVGAMRTAVVLEPEGAIDLVGIRLRPGGAAGLVDVPAAEVAGSIPALEEVASGLATLYERVGNADERADAALAVLEPLLKRATAPDARLARAIALLESTRGDAAIDRAAREAGWSTRHLQRRFAQDVGLGPKTYARILRVQAAARAAPEAARIGWAAVAGACGFFDQAHLIRDFRAIAGSTPTTFFGRSQALGEVFAGG